MSDTRLATAPAVGSPEWITARRRGLGASDIGAAVGASRWTSRLALWEIKTGRVEAFVGNSATRWGHRLESWVIDDWCEIHAAEVLESQPTYQIPRDPTGPLTPEIWATPDAIVLMPDGERACLEAKTTTWRNKELGEEESDELPVEWIAQAQCQMAATGLDRCYFAVLVDGRELREFCVERDSMLWARLRVKAEEFWEYVARDWVPPVDWAHIPDVMHRFRWLGVDLPEVDLRGDPAADKWAEYETLGKEISEREKRREKLKAEFAAALGDHGLARVSDDREVRVIRVAGGHVEYDRQESFQLRARKVK